MSKWTVTPDSKHGLLALYHSGPATIYWLTLEEAQDLAEQLLNAIETLETTVAAPAAETEKVAHD